MPTHYYNHLCEAECSSGNACWEGWLFNCSLSFLFQDFQSTTVLLLKIKQRVFQLSAALMVFFSIFSKVVPIIRGTDDAKVFLKNKLRVFIIGGTKDFTITNSDSFFFVVVFVNMDLLIRGTDDFSIKIIFLRVWF